MINVYLDNDDVTLYAEQANTTTESKTDLAPHPIFKNMPEGSNIYKNLWSCPTYSGVDSSLTVDALKGTCYVDSKVAPALCRGMYNNLNSNYNTGSTYLYIGPNGVELGTVSNGIFTSTKTLGFHRNLHIDFVGAGGNGGPIDYGLTWVKNGAGGGGAGGCVVRLYIKSFPSKLTKIAYLSRGTHGSNAGDDGGSSKLTCYDGDTAVASVTAYGGSGGTTNSGGSGGGTTSSGLSNSSYDHTYYKLTLLATQNGASGSRLSDGGGVYKEVTFNTLITNKTVIYSTSGGRGRDLSNPKGTSGGGGSLIGSGYGRQDNFTDYSGNNPGVIYGGYGGGGTGGSVVNWSVAGIGVNYAPPSEAGNGIFRIWYQ